jgi:hypothetical protein
VFAFLGDNSIDPDIAIKSFVLVPPKAKWPRGFTSSKALSFFGRSLPRPTLFLPLKKTAKPSDIA